MDSAQAISIANIAALVAVAGVGVRLIQSFTRIEMKVELMWSDFRQRMPYARRDDDHGHSDDR